jgi:hypothetical protein
MTEDDTLQIAQWYLEGDPRAETGRAYWNAWSLGSWGGYGIFGFDHSVVNSGGYDLVIEGNAFSSMAEEPGAVWVMQDENGNGLPDDTWYELAGSYAGGSGTIQRYARTFYRPAPGETFGYYTDNRGSNGSIGAGYFPYFLHADAVTYTGTKIEVGVATLSGYVDVKGGLPQFRISDAVQQDGTPVRLDYIDFVKIQTMGGTEFRTPRDYHLNVADRLVLGVDAGGGNYNYVFSNNSGYSPLEVQLRHEDGSVLRSFSLTALGLTVAVQADRIYFEFSGGNCSYTVSGNAVTFVNHQ